MTLNTKIIKQAGFSVLALATLLALGACSSKPSPWSQQQSPWDSRAQETPVEEAQAEASPFVDEAAPAESAYAEPVEPVGPAGMAGMEEPMAEPAMEEAMPVEADAMAEPEPMVEEPMMAAAASGGDINSQPPGHFAVQVVASSSMDNLKAFAKANEFSDQWTAQTNVNGTTWFVLLKGIYASKAEADAALSEVQGLDTSPWIRTVGSLQAVMIQ